MELERPDRGNLPLRPEESLMLHHRKMLGPRSPVAYLALALSFRLVTDMLEEVVC